MPPTIEATGARAHSTHAVRALPALADAWEQVADAASAMVRDLMLAYREEIHAGWRDESRYLLAASIGLRGAANAPLVTVQLCWTTDLGGAACVGMRDGAPRGLHGPRDRRGQGDLPGVGESRDRRDLRERRDWPGQDGPGEPHGLCGNAERSRAWGGGGAAVAGDVREGGERPFPASTVGRREETSPLIGDALRLVREDGAASPARLQRHFGIGYTRAITLLEALRTLGIVTRDPEHPEHWLVIAEDDEPAAPSAVPAAGDCGEEAVGNSAEESAARPGGQVVVNSGEEAGADSRRQVAANFANQIAAKSGDRVAAKSGDRVAAKSGDRVVAKSGDRVVAMPCDQAEAAERSARPAHGPAESAGITRPFGPVDTETCWVAEILPSTAERRGGPTARRQD